MSTKKTSQQLLQEKEQAQARKEELLKIKSETPKSFTKALQEELDTVTERLVDIDDELEQLQLNGEESEEETEEAYVPEKGTENMVHLSIVHGQRFDPRTGKPTGVPYNQIFSRSEFNHFKQYYDTLGYTVVKVLHDPTGEAKNLLVK